MAAADATAVGSVSCGAAEAVPGLPAPPAGAAPVVPPPSEDAPEGGHLVELPPAAWTRIVALAASGR